MEKPKLIPLVEYSHKLDEYKEYLLINKNDLDSALVEQSTLYYRIGEAYAAVISYRDLEKSRLEEVRAEIDQMIRAESSIKLTETQVANRILSHDHYIDAQERLASWKLLADKWVALRDAFNQRAYALRDLVSLYSMGYYTESIGRGEKAEARDRLASDIRPILAEERKRRGLHNG
jgi:hypothetical protein